MKLLWNFLWEFLWDFHMYFYENFNETFDGDFDWKFDGNFNRNLNGNFNGNFVGMMGILMEILMEILMGVLWEFLGWIQWDGLMTVLTVSLSKSKVSMNLSEKGCPPVKNFFCLLLGKLHDNSAIVLFCLSNGNICCMMNDD